jgi:hypothetical protein
MSVRSPIYAELILYNTEGVENNVFLSNFHGVGMQDSSKR